jgi:uncharacterized membrane protein HdeD (DUF308 family)
MEIRVTNSGAATGSAYDVRGMSSAVREIARYWWLWLVIGIASIVAALVILQFNHASIVTVSVILGIMFAVAAVQQFMLTAVADSLRWLWAIFGVLFAACSVICFVEPAGTFTGLANVLGFLFLCVGVWWIIQAFLTKAVNSMWWVGLTAGILMVVLGFWTSGQFFLQRAYTLLVFAGIWALMQGITEIIRAFQIRSLREEG